MVRLYLAAVAVSLALAFCLAAQRKPAQLACTADTNAQAVTIVKNINRKVRGMPLLTCVPDNVLAWRP